jgi:hypothetical protein
MFLSITFTVSFRVEFYSTDSFVIFLSFFVHDLLDISRSLLPNINKLQ